ncbi:Cys-tRNA(Pro) deacylase [Agrobacterium salinitolerans]|uniref:Cys-tRNA(Pro)/Cys-tRNA(Cys) deacylase n=1 Tax=Agrobacterium salinitolerans TaxID=1183413 RepID=A0ABY3BKR8_9HYPH|nr:MULTISPECIES: Cys-tRNA(Pro) deacylase [Agrobacterium]MCZ7850861.1 Cys-tRNA(Pro) deacylase [Agrobacterium salinitolerans]MCZ7892497.1 Cys-tRNA(Pro) deacylase [Agrobacterium salinitolerans]MCZ7974523.1 Cys-tRNA(Pro) deacylase [Agrobacterium salinitolerans]TRA85680.1 Cys-tRNA(Pro) deacylase [Agrobacterium salinitolerans]
MSKTTRATQMLTKAGIAFTTVTYDYDPNADRIGLQAAEAIGEAPHLVLKTLMAELDGKPVCVIVPSDREVSMKKLAAAFSGKSASMMKPADAERATGYHVGGISPFGQKKQVPTAIEAAAMAHDCVYMNGGQRGLQVRLSPRDAQKALKAIAAPLVAD